MKIIGALLIILSSVLAAFYYERHKRGSISDLKALKMFLEYIKNQIEYFSYPLNRIFQSYETNNSLIRSIIKGEKYKLVDIKLENEVKECFFNLGKGYKKEQLDRLNYLIMQIDKELTTIESEQEKKIRVFRALSLFIGSCVVILLV